MASSFISKQKSGITSTDNTIYTAPTGKVGVMFSGIFSNKTNTDTSYLTLVLKNPSTNITTYILNNVPLMFGSSLEIPKIVVVAGSQLIAKVDTITSGKVDLTLNILEKDV